MYLIALIPKINKLQTSLVDYLDNTVKIQLITVFKKRSFLIQKYQLLKIFQKLEMKDLNLFILRLL